jgi:tetratricopeptide (TPR) repeat protein
MSTSQHIIDQLLKRVRGRWMKPSGRAITFIAAVVVVGLYVTQPGARVEAKSLRSSVAPGAAYASQQSSGRAKGQKTTPSTQLDVTFITDVPETDIYLQNEKIGTTGKDGQLLVKVPPGEYRATANRTDYYLKHQTIIVNRRQTTFKFFMGQPIPRSAASPTPTPRATPRPTPPPNDKTQAESIIERFLNPKTTDQVKQPDWQSLLTSTYQELSRDPSNAGLKAQAQFAQGQLDYLNGNFANALDAFLGASRALPDYALASYGLGQVYLARNLPQQAVTALERATQLNPKLAIAYKVLGDAFQVLKKEKESTAAYAQAYELGYLPSDATLNRVRSHVKAERWSEALAMLPRLAADSPSAEVYILMGDSYVGQSQRVNAFQAYTKATELDPNSALAFYKLGEIQFRERNYEEAQKALGRALILDVDGRIIDRRKASNMMNEAGSKLRKIGQRVDKPAITKP